MSGGGRYLVWLSTFRQVVLCPLALRAVPSGPLPSALASEAVGGVGVRAAVHVAVGSAVFPPISPVPRITILLFLIVFCQTGASQTCSS